MKNIFITGATSFIGIYLIEELNKKGYNVTALIRKNSTKKNLLLKYPNIDIVEIDLEDIEKLPHIINKKCDVFYHLAWNGTRGAARDDENLQKSNYEYSINTLKIAKEMGVKVFISAGSQAEYGLYKDVVTENTEEKPVTEYGKYKLYFCNYAKDYCDKNDIKFIEPRFFSLYGCGDYEKTLVISCIDKMLNNEDVDLTQSIQLWNFLNIKDAVKALICLQESGKTGIYNFGSEDTRPLKDFIYEIYNLTNSHSKLNFGSIPYSSSGIINVNPSITKLKNETDWIPTITFKEGIEEIIEKRKQK